MPSHEGIEHVGFVVSDRKRFERFWCRVLGYHKVREGRLSDALVSALFSLPGNATTIRYKGSGGPDVEIHVFECGPDPASPAFSRGGLNHVSIKVRNKAKWARRLPADVEQRWFDNPGGWKNLFVRDYDGNWIEVRD